MKFPGKNKGLVVAIVSVIGGGLTFLGHTLNILYGRDRAKEFIEKQKKYEEYENLVSDDDVKLIRNSHPDKLKNLSDLEIKRTYGKIRWINKDKDSLFEEMKNEREKHQKD